MTYIAGAGSGDMTKAVYDPANELSDIWTTVTDYRIKLVGSATMVLGSVVVNTSFATNTAKIWLTARAGTLNLGSLSVGAISNGESFTINSTNVLDSRVVDYLVFEP